MVLFKFSKDDFAKFMLNYEIWQKKKKYLCKIK